MVNATIIRPDSQIAGYLPGAALFDAFELAIDAADPRPALEIYIALMAQTPSWINRLMSARDRAAAIVGLKPLGRLDATDPARAIAAYRPGDRVGIFAILSVSEREVVLIETDKHLDARVSLYKTGNGYRDVAVFSTVIHTHNLLGRAYLLPVWPLHKLMIPAMLGASPNGVRSAPAEARP